MYVHAFVAFTVLSPCAHAVLRGQPLRTLAQSCVGFAPLSLNGTAVLCCAVLCRSDRYLAVHSRFFMREIRVIAYQQFLESYRVRHCWPL